MAFLVIHYTSKLRIAHCLNPREVYVLAHLLDCLDKHHSRHGSTLHCSKHMEELQTKTGATICEEPMIAIRGASDHMEAIHFLFQLPRHQGDGHHRQDYQPSEETLKALRLVPKEDKMVSISFLDTITIMIDLLKNDPDFEPPTGV